MKKDANTYLKLFTSSFYISIFIIGGGYVAIPLLQKKFVEQLRWIEEDEMTDLVAIAQSAPGAIAVNSAISVGYKIAGVPGVFCTLLGTILPPLILITIIQKFYALFISNPYIANLFKGMNAAVAAIMVDIVIKMAKDSSKTLKKLALPLMLTVFLLVFFLRINPFFIILTCILAGAAIELATQKRGASK